MPVFCALRSHPLHAVLLPSGLFVSLLVGLLGLPGCGDDSAAPPASDSSAPQQEWSRPVVPEGSGSPDGRVDGVQGADELLADLRARIADGRGHADASYQQSVELVAAVLWDVHAVYGLEDHSDQVRAAAAVHQQVAAIAGEVSHWLAASPSARAERSKTNPTDLAIHDAFLTASAKGAGAYRAWCGEAGPKLLREHREATYRKLIPERVPRVDGPDGLNQGR